MTVSVVRVHSPRMLSHSGRKAEEVRSQVERLHPKEPTMNYHMFELFNVPYDEQYLFKPI